MSLINCPNCGQSVSDKATLCPNCSYTFAEKLATAQNIFCEECGTGYEKELSACPNCGCPTPKPKKKSKYKKYIGIIIAATVLAVICILGVTAYENFKAQEYYDNMKTATYTMLNGAADAETAGNLIKSVWSNAIRKKRDEETDKFTMKNGSFVSDFNDAMDVLFTDEEFEKSMSDLKSNQSRVADLMKKLKNPPKKYEEAYNALQKYYENYLKMTKLVISPTGSLNSFSDDFNTYDTETVNAYEKMKIYLD